MTAITPIGRHRRRRGAWPLERALFALSGTMTLLAVALTVVVSKWFVLLTALVGVNQWAYVMFGACPASLLLRRKCELRSALAPSLENRAARDAEVMV